MQSAHSLSDVELLARMPVLVQRERAAAADVIEHLIEVDRRKLYLGQACSSLSAYCRERLGYSEDEASKRVRVARLARDVPAMLDELRAGRIHLTGLFVLSQFANAANAHELIVEARGKSRRDLERALAARFPKADVPQRITCENPKLLKSNSGVVRPLSATRFAIQFTVSAELESKIQRAKELLSHSIPSGDLAQIVERALDDLIAREERRRVGAGQPRKRRDLKEGSRHVPVEVARVVWERDGGQCTFVNGQGQRCSERRFITIEHRLPFARGGTSLDPENLCLLCRAHNHYTAQQAYGPDYIARKRSQRALAPRELAHGHATAPEPAAASREPADSPPAEARRESTNSRREPAAARPGSTPSLAEAELCDGRGAAALLRTAIQSLTPNAKRCA